MIFWMAFVILMSYAHCQADIFEDANSCPNEGLQCSDDCTSVNFCPVLGGEPITLRTCQDKLLCSNSTGIPECDAYVCHMQGAPAPICGVAGAFPSPYNCTAYYICSQVGDDNPKQFSCENGLNFDATTGNCDNAPCHDPKTCTKPGDYGTIDDSGVFCFYCSDENRPLVMRCADSPSLANPTSTAVPSTSNPSQPTSPKPPATTGTTSTDPSSSESTSTTDSPTSDPTSSDPQSSEPSSSTNIPTSNPSSSEPTSTTDSPTSDPTSDQPTSSTNLPTEKPTTTETSPPTMECSALGQKFPDPTRCNAYWVCTSRNGPPEFRRCPVNYSYDDKIRKCVNKPC